MADLNQGQTLAAEAFFSFLFSEKKGFIISGAAGVGKTFLMSHIIDKIIPAYQENCQIMGIPATYDDVMMTATTNKAAEILSVATNRPTSTIHSFMNLKVQDDFDTGKSKITKTRNWMIHSNLILFIDECSMIDSDLFQIIQEGTHNCKIVYVGDHNQLAPVMETLSPVYKQGYDFYELTEPMRNSGQPALMNICNQLRKTVETNVFEPIQIVPGVIDYFNGQQMQEKLDSMFAQQNGDSRILAYTNKQVMAYNDHIRATRQLPHSFIEGEYLVNNAAIQISRSRMLSVEEEIMIEKIHGTDLDEIVRGTFMEFMRCTIRTKIGEFFETKIPVNRKHYSDLIAYFRRNKNWERYYYLKNTYPDLRQRDAATVYKAQGSTYDSVFIDLGDISTCTHVNQAARMLYVAFSRAKNNVYLYGKLAEKYGSIIQ